MSGNLHDSNASVVVLPEGRHAAQHMAPAAQYTVPPAQAVAAPPDDPVAPCEKHSPTPLLTKLLQLADRFRAEDSPREAMAMYFDLAEGHPGTPEAYDALERLLEIASQYENGGDIRQARSLYERLL
jgi:hypothetical protein